MNLKQLEERRRLQDEMHFCIYLRLINGARKAVKSSEGKAKVFFKWYIY